MAVIHISAAEAARDFAGLLAKVRSGDQVRIETGVDSFEVVRKNGAGKATPFAARAEFVEELLRPRYTEPRLLSEALADIEAYGSDATLDDGFGDALEEVIRSQEHERLIDPWEPF